MTRAALAALSFLCATSALAETPMTAEEFDAFATGKTLDYYESGQVFGREVYLPDRQVRWAFSGDECKMGRWFQQDQMICFLYDGDPEAKCWTIWRDGDGLAAAYATDTPDIPPRTVLQTDEPLACPGPDVGV